MNARYDHFIVDNFVCLIDRDEPGCRSVTNDIERIIEQDLADLLLPHRRLVYRDSEKRWDEVVIEHRGGRACFLEFRPLGHDDSRLADLFDLLTPAYFGEPSDDDLLKMGYERPFKVLDDGRIAGLMPINLNVCALVVGIHSMGHHDAFYYRTREQAKRALNEWRGDGEPRGWVRHPQSGRRREDGDPAKEYMQP
ncbi:hypothetical protein AWB80_02916 [Caballeronia pedi]|uniref:Uncharacterized protein n=1 Tax=Caballeronia pedi TaxID=1777141 RepID=A0A158B0M0_9BURK|nr:hypothetical protein [Caballeronia pedi]SAK63758.1 hypothetical protein AWB80_02916 [Caballeronia pedi]